jgi:hypothetical protein
MPALAPSAAKNLDETTSPLSFLTSMENPATCGEPSSDRRSEPLLSSASGGLTPSREEPPLSEQETTKIELQLSAAAIKPIARVLS